MGVSTFSLGFGPKLIKWQKGKTEYALSLIPLGGYVALVGESDDAEIPQGFTEQECFFKRPAWQRLLVVLAGPVANLLMAWFIYAGLAFFWGTPHLLAVVGGVQEASPAQRAGLQPGDKIIAINGNGVVYWEEMSQYIAQSMVEPMDFEITRMDAATGQLETLHVRISAEKRERKNIFGEMEVAWLVGVKASGSVEKNPESFGMSIVSGAKKTVEMISLTCEGFVKLFKRAVPLDQVGGPIMIAQLVGEQAKQGIIGLLALTALISINLGILNLLPIPVLDGGAILFCALEMVLRRPISKKVQIYAMRFGISILVALMVLATYNDVVRIIRS